jgi:hypothetical protein
MLVGNKPHPFKDTFVYNLFGGSLGIIQHWNKSPIMWGALKRFSGNQRHLLPILDFYHSRFNAYNINTYYLLIRIILLINTYFCGSNEKLHRGGAIAISNPAD